MSILSPLTYSYVPLVLNIIETAKSVIRSNLYDVILNTDSEISRKFLEKYS